MDARWDITSREGWEDIARMRVKGKAVTVTFKKGRSYAAWDGLLANVSPMPAHKIARQELQRPLAGLARHRQRAVQVRELAEGDAAHPARRTTRTRAGPKAKVDRVVFRYIPSTASLFQALNAGEIDATEPQPQLQIVDIRKNSRFKVQSGPGYFWEHLDIQFGAKGAAGAEAEVRAAGPHHGHQPGPDPAGALHHAGPRRVGEGAAGPPEPHLQAVRAVLPAELEEVGLRPEEGHQPAALATLHGRPEPAVGEQRRHLELPGRREAVVPLHDDEREPAPCADVRDRSEAAQERRHRAPAAVRPVGHRLRTGAPLG